MFGTATEGMTYSWVEATPLPTGPLSLEWILEAAKRATRGQSPLLQWLQTDGSTSTMKFTVQASVSSLSPKNCMLRLEVTRLKASPTTTRNGPQPSNLKNMESLDALLSRK